MHRLGGGIAAMSALILIFLSSAPASAAAQPSMTVSPLAGIVGSTVMVSGEGFPPDTRLALQWGTVNASWAVAGNPSQVTGMTIVPTEKVVAEIHTDQSGAFSANVTVPTDYGGKHVIQAVEANGTALPARGLFNVEPSFALSSTSGAAGSPIVVTARGLGYTLYSTSYHLYWDNSYVGYFTAISSAGATNFTFYSSGVPGVHYIDIYQGYPGPGYLNPQQGPPSSETQSVFPPYIPFHAQYVITDANSGGLGLLVPGNVQLMVLVVGIGALGMMVARNGDVSGRRRGASRMALALLVIVLVAVGGVAAYFALSPSGSGAATFVPQATAVRPTIQVSETNVTSGPRISVTPNVASVGEEVTVSGAGFAPNAQLPLTWSTRKGSNLNGYQLVAEPLRTVTASSDGSFSFGMIVPPDLGGLHFIAASNLTGRSNGTLFLQRTASINVTEGPAGTTVAVTMTGVGWTFDTNIAALDYDNSYLGYGCGFNSGGNVTFYLRVTGAPGVHTIDIYPSVWWGPSGPTNPLAAEYRYPLLTPQDHPALMPSFHFTFLITSTPKTQTGAVIPFGVPLLGLLQAVSSAALMGPTGPREKFMGVTGR